MNKFFKTIGLLTMMLFGFISVSFTGTAGDQVYINFGSFFVGHSYVQLFKI